MFIRLGLNNEKSLHTLPLQSLHLLSLLKIECPLSVAASLILTAKLMMCRENPAKCPSLTKNLPKYTTANIVQ
jgi:hypothetical protein